MKLNDAGIYDLINIFKGKPTDAHSASQGGIINNTSRVINIPAYQRPYRWGEENINRLFLDYDENSAEYFLGSAVVVKNEKADRSIEFDMVDGQQRITTLYLINYIRFMLKREYVLEKISRRGQLRASEYCNQLKDYYVELIGKNTKPFDNIQKRIDELAEDDSLNTDEKVQYLVDCYKAELCIPAEKGTPQETLREKLNKAHEFFDNEQLCLKYSRKRYDMVLRDALCIVYLKHVENTNRFDLCVITQDDPFTQNYLNALKTIFDNVWQRAEKTLNKDSASLMEICEKAITYLDELIKNMSLCIVLTDEEKDANRLFEVLNDRSLDVEDLELIKNHFYKEYCTKSGDSDDEIDSRIAELDELWADKIFCDNAESRKKLISYFAAMYLTMDTELVFKDDAKLKDAIERGYSSKEYSKLTKKYTYQDIRADFNVYLAVKVIMDQFGVKTKKSIESSLTAEQANKSITYKTIHLLNALKYTAVMPALINVIISTYTQQDGCSLVTSDFEASFTDYIIGLISDNNHIDCKYQKIHNCAYVLWVAAIKAENFVIPRNIAKRIISKYGRLKYTNENIDFELSEAKELDVQFENWLSAWNYSSSKDFIIKILLLNLLLTNRDVRMVDGDKHPVIMFNVGLVYNLEASKLQLDHLEAQKINSAAPQNYYLNNDIEKRNKELNGYLGNFMILDHADNNLKNNVPMKEALRFYEKIEMSWLINDIENMMSDDNYFDLENNIPREEFFKVRTSQLKKYFKAFLNRSLDKKEIIVEGIVVK